MAWGNTYPDPGIEHGSFKVLPCTQGGYWVIDVRRKPGKQAVGAKFRLLEDAARAAKDWHEAGHG